MIRLNEIKGPFLPDKQGIDSGVLIIPSCCKGFLLNMIRSEIKVMMIFSI